MSPHPILRQSPLGFPWPTLDPFLFCVHHDDAYPRGNAHFGPDARLAGRDLGQDFGRKDGWSMYHGTDVPGFPAHPHRGFETVTVVRSGYIDHADSAGATARYGPGDVQWLTAGRGLQHAEMLPLLDREAPNPLELFQIWLNLPARNKMAAPHFTMFWAESVPCRRWSDAEGRSTDVTGVAGRLPSDNGGALVNGTAEPLAPPPDSWAAQPEADVAIWTIRIAPHAQWTLPAAAGKGTRRSLYVYTGAGLTVAGHTVPGRAALELRADVAVPLVNGEAESRCLLLQGRPLNEPVAQYGPFVMNTQHELVQAFDDYRRTQFGGWPWPDAAPVHGAEPVRFARHADGRLERPEPAG